MVRIGSASIVFERWDIQFYFRLYREILDLQERHADEEFQNWERKMADEFRRVDEDMQQDLIDHYVEEYDSKQFFKVILMNSFFVASYALYEHRRELIVDKYCVSKSDFKNSALMTSSEWQEIKHYKTIRNKIIHEGGVIRNRKDAVDYAEKKGIAGDSLRNGRYALKRQFCDEALNTFERFLLKGLVEFSRSDGGG